MASKKASKKEIDLVVPEFVSTFGSSLKPKAKTEPSFHKESKASGGGNHAATNPSSPPGRDLTKPLSVSPPASFNSMQTLPASPVKQALAQAQHSFGSKAAAERSKENSQTIEVPEFISTYTSKSKSSAPKPHSPPPSTTSGLPQPAPPPAADPSLASEEIFEDLMDSVMAVAAGEGGEGAGLLGAGPALTSSAAVDSNQNRDSQENAAAPSHTVARLDSGAVLTLSAPPSFEKPSADVESDEVLKRKLERRKRKAAALPRCEPTNSATAHHTADAVTHSHAVHSSASCDVCVTEGGAQECDAAAGVTHLMPAQAPLPDKNRQQQQQRKKTIANNTQWPQSEDPLSLLFRLGAFISCASKLFSFALTKVAFVSSQHQNVEWAARPTATVHRRQRHLERRPFFRQWYPEQHQVHCHGPCQ